MKCNSCHQEVYLVSIYGIMPWDQVEGREPASICMDCTDRCPCGTKGYWFNDELHCKHGYVYKKDYYWDGNNAAVFAKPRGRKWWSYLIISNTKHKDATTNTI
jgi:hypothetical protein